MLGLSCLFAIFPLPPLWPPLFRFSTTRWHLFLHARLMPSIRECGSTHPFPDPARDGNMWQLCSWPARCSSWDWATWVAKLMSKVGLSLTFVKSLCYRNGGHFKPLRTCGQRKPKQRTCTAQLPRSKPAQTTHSNWLLSVPFTRANIPIHFSPALPRWWTKVYLKLKLNLKESRLRYPAVKAPSNPHWGLPLGKFIISIEWNQQKTATKPSKLWRELLQNRVEENGHVLHSIPSY